MTWNLTVRYYGVNSSASEKILFGTYYRPLGTGIEYFELFRKSFTAINNKFDKVFLVVDFKLPNFDWFNQARLSSETIYWNVYELYKRCMSYPSKQLSYT